MSWRWALALGALAVFSATFSATASAQNIADSAQYISMDRTGQPTPTIAACARYIIVRRAAADGTPFTETQKAQLGTLPVSFVGQVNTEMLTTTPGTVTFPAGVDRMEFMVTTSNGSLVGTPNGEPEMCPTFANRAAVSGSGSGWWIQLWCQGGVQQRGRDCNPMHSSGKIPNDYAGYRMVSSVKGAGNINFTHAGYRGQNQAANPVKNLAPEPTTPGPMDQSLAPGADASALPGMAAFFQDGNAPGTTVSADVNGSTPYIRQSLRFTLLDENSRNSDISDLVTVPGLMIDKFTGEFSGNLPMNTVTGTKYQVAVRATDYNTTSLSDDIAFILTATGIPVMPPAGDDTPRMELVPDNSATPNVNETHTVTSTTVTLNFQRVAGTGGTVSTVNAASVDVTPAANSYLPADKVVATIAAGEMTGSVTITRTTDHEPNAATLAVAQTIIFAATSGTSTVFTAPSGGALIIPMVDSVPYFQLADATPAATADPFNVTVMRQGNNNAAADVRWSVTNAAASDPVAVAVPATLAGAGTLSFAAAPDDRSTNSSATIEVERTVPGPTGTGNANITVSIIADPADPDTYGRGTTHTKADIPISRAAGAAQISITGWPDDDEVDVGSDATFTVTRTGGDLTSTLEWDFSIDITNAGASAPKTTDSVTLRDAPPAFAANSATATGQISASGLGINGDGGAGQIITVRLLAPDHAIGAPANRARLVTGSYTIPVSGDGLERDYTYVTPAAKGPQPIVDSTITPAVQGRNYGLSLTGLFTLPTSITTFTLVTTTNPCTGFQLDAGMTRLIGTGTDPAGSVTATADAKCTVTASDGTNPASMTTFLIPVIMPPVATADSFGISSDHTRSATLSGNVITGVVGTGLTTEGGATDIMLGADTYSGGMVSNLRVTLINSGDTYEEDEAQSVTSSGTTLTFSANQGSLAINDMGAFTYTPPTGDFMFQYGAFPNRVSRVLNPGESNTIRATYRIADMGLSAATADGLLTITVTGAAAPNAPPVPVDDPIAIDGDDASLAVTDRTMGVLANDTDDGDATMLVVTRFAQAANATAAYDLLSSVPAGSATRINFLGTTTPDLANGDKVADFTLNVSGTYTLTLVDSVFDHLLVGETELFYVRYRIQDEDMAFNTDGSEGLITITVNGAATPNTAPTLVSNPTVEAATYGTAYSMDLARFFEDAEMDGLTFEITTGTCAGFTIGGMGNGFLVGAGTDPEGAVTATAASTSCTVTANDGTVDSAPASFSIAVTFPAPVVSLGTPLPTTYDADVGGALTFPLVRTGDPRAELNVNVNVSITRPDGMNRIAQYTRNATIRANMSEGTASIPHNNAAGVGAAVSGDTIGVRLVAGASSYTIGSASSFMVSVGGNTPPTVAVGDPSASLTEDDSTTSRTGTLSVTDAEQTATEVTLQECTDTGTACTSFADATVPGDVDGTYGTFALTATSWTYTLDNTADATNALEGEESVRDILRLRANDGTGGTSSTSLVVSVIITITGANDKPTLNLATNLTASEDVSRTFALTDFGWADAEDTSPTVGLDIPPVIVESGVATTTPAGSFFNEEAEEVPGPRQRYLVTNPIIPQVSFAPVNRSANYTARFVVTPRDSDGLFGDPGNLDFVVTAVNDAPTVKSEIENTRATVDSPFTLNISGNFEDVDTDQTLTYTMQRYDSPLIAIPISPMTSG